MPDIPILGESPSLDWIRLESLMLYPDNEKQRNSYFNVRRWKEFIAEEEGGSNILIPAHDLQLIIDSQSWCDFENESVRRFQEALYAGEVLLIHYYMNKIMKEKEPSIRKSIFTICEMSKNSPQYDVYKMPTTEKTVWKYLKKYKTVFHIAAGYSIFSDWLEGKSKEIENITADDICYRNFIGVWLAAIDFFYSYGSKFIEGRSGTPLLNTNEAYSIPKNIKTSTFSEEQIELRLPIVDSIIERYSASDIIVVKS